MIKELVTFVIQQLVSRPQDVEVAIIAKDDVSLLEVKVAPEDRGRVIGKEGHTIKALRSLVAHSLLDSDKKFFLELSR